MLKTTNEIYDEIQASITESLGYRVGLGDFPTMLLAISEAIAKAYNELERKLYPPHWTEEDIETYNRMQEQPKEHISQYDFARVEEVRDDLGRMLDTLSYYPHKKALEEAYDKFNDFLDEQAELLWPKSVIK